MCAGASAIRSELSISGKSRPPQLAASFISNRCDVGYWHFSTDCAVRSNVCCWGRSRHGTDITLDGECTNAHPVRLIGSIKVASSPSARELFNRFDTGHFCNTFSPAGSIRLSAWAIAAPPRINSYNYFSAAVERN